MSSDILHQSSWARSARGKPIEKFSSGNDSPYLFVGGVHGDEPEGVELAQQFLSWLQKNNKESFHSWILIPCLNVDGYAKRDRTNGHGVDLNRNFPSPDWNSLFKAPRYYPGGGPASEPEVQALCQLIETTKPKAIIHFHSWEPCVVYTGEPGRAVAETLALETGYEVREDIGYPTPGSLGQYGWLVHKIPVICIEEKDHIDLSEVWPRFRLGLQTLLSQR
jgi:predicted deacylase